MQEGPPTLGSRGNMIDRSDFDNGLRDRLRLMIIHGIESHDERSDRVLSRFTHFFVKVALVILLRQLRLDICVTQLILC